LLQDFKGVGCLLAHLTTQHGCLALAPAKLGQLLLLLLLRVLVEHTGVEMVLVL
jgi:hypothetical protein